MKFLTKIFKKQKPVEDIEEAKIVIPDLMEPEDNINNKIDLMAADSGSIINNNEPVKVEKKPEIIESPGIENQLTEDLISEKTVNDHQIETISITPNAFNMTPTSKEESLIETLDTETVNLQKTQKYCKECGTPNDMLNKFCVSCGYNFK